MIRVQAEPINVGAALGALHAGRTDIGAVASFLGLVRDHSTAGERLVAMTLEHYPGMTERELERVESEARERFALDASLIIHRYGRLEPGDDIVFCATAASHRRIAFDACAFLMDWLKTKAPFWKFEETTDGGDWVAARESDHEAAERWR